MTNDAPRSPESNHEVKSTDEEQFQLSPKMLVVGILMVALGIVCGLVMSSATFIR